MKTNPNTGELTLASGTILSPQSTRSIFLSSPDGARSEVLVKNEPWCSFTFSENDESLEVSVFFKGEILDSVHLSIINPRFGCGWNDWSEEKEMERKKENERWLISKGLIPGKQYSWGSVWSGYDSKGGFSSAIISYQAGT